MDPNTKTNSKAAESNAGAGAVAAGDQPMARVAPLQADRWQLGEFLNARHAVTLPSGTPFENVLRPEFWANIVRIKPDDIIEVRTDDRTFYAELMVLGKGRNWATVCVIREPVALRGPSLPAAETSGYKVEYAGSHAQWRALRVSDNQVMRDKFPTQDAALAWVRNQERAQAH